MTDSSADVTEEDLRRARYGAEIVNFLPILRAEVDRSIRAIDNRMKEAVKKGELTPERSQAAWIERVTLNDLVSRFEQQARAVGMTLTS